MRVTRPAEFTAVLRTGRRAGTRHLALHLLSAPPAVQPSAVPTAAADGSIVDTRSVRPARAGFVVSSAVGNSVVRHRVTRRLREQVRPLLAELPPGCAVVVRAFPSAATATSDDLARDLRSALRRAQHR